MQKGADYSERSEYACMADPAGFVCGIPSGWIYCRGGVAAEDIRSWDLDCLRRHFSWNVLFDSWLYTKYENPESDAQ